MEEGNHECCVPHIQSEISRGLFESYNRIDLQLVNLANRQISERREILKVIIEVLIFAAQQNIPLRGHDETNNSMNQGNFLEILNLLANYHPILQHHLDKIKRNTRNRLTFLSHECQNKLLSILSEMIQDWILKEVKQSGLFGIIIDTITDVTKLEQMCFAIRYVNKNGEVQERLVFLVTAPDSSGMGLYQVFCDITNKHNLDWKNNLCAQAYDGAASMQGLYSGLRSFIQKENPRALYIWYFAHVLNLVIVDTCDSSIVTKVFLGDVQALNEFMRARKRTATFVKFQNEFYSGDRICSLKQFFTTRWISHGRAIIVVFQKFKALVKTLNYLTIEKEIDRDTASNAKSLAHTVTSFKFVITMLLMKDIFDITTPLSKCLQSKNLDFIQALVLVDQAKKRLTNYEIR